MTHEDENPGGADAEQVSAAEHLENSERLAAEAHRGWEETPPAHEADDAHHPGTMGQQAPAD
ncbi:hypothetical protein AB2L28_15130 [Kineococcus sp. TBRC 1896]|uniref:Uncharacterized protein n=1 Tax=Kineococcus mangrovi TaxID=1660183 RepID=A0ABV4I8H5_9ACTN